MRLKARGSKLQQGDHSSVTITDKTDSTRGRFSSSFAALHHRSLSQGPQPPPHTLFNCFVNSVPSRHVMVPIPLQLQALITELLITLWFTFSFSRSPSNLGYLQSRLICGHHSIRRIYSWNCMFGLNFDKLGQLQSNYNPNWANYNPTTTKKHQPRSSSSKHVENSVITQAPVKCQLLIKEAMRRPLNLEKFPRGFGSSQFRSKRFELPDSIQVKQIYLGNSPVAEDRIQDIWLNLLFLIRKDKKRCVRVSKIPWLSIITQQV